MSARLYKHNLIAYEAATKLLDETGKAAIIHPTGTGKSFIGFYLAEQNSTKVICWVSPSEYIYRTQKENWKKCGGESLGNIKFFTYARLMNLTEEELKEVNPQYIVLDEYHRAGAECWQKGVERLLNLYKDIPVLGLSATNIRYLDNQRDMAEELFGGNIASEITLGEAIARGILKAPKYVVSIYSYAKDLKRYELKAKHAKSAAVRDSAEKYLDAIRRSLNKADGLDKVFEKHMPNRQGKYIVFCSGVEHMDGMIEKIPEMFRKIDTNPHIYRAYSEDPETSREFARFKRDRSDHLKLLFCIDMLNEGVHVDDIDGVILFRPTVSPIIYKQQIGRAMSAGKDRQPVIFDIVNNFENLYSIGTVQEEMNEAIAYYRSLGESEEIVKERFEIIDEVREAKELFDKLNETLSASWDLMYSYAKAYFEKNGNLEVPKRYKTPEGYSLGSWVLTQRRVRAGEVYGNLTQERIEKLDKIGMVWENVRELSFNRYFKEAENYFAEHGDLLVPVSFITENGVRLGAWIANVRTDKKCGRLSGERCDLLESIGMQWEARDSIWDRNFALAATYYAANGNLNIPRAYITDDGVRLGSWLANQRTAKLTEKQRQRLNSLGMVWEDRSTLLWQRLITEVKAYKAKFNSVEVPTDYITEKGYKLGKILSRFRNDKKLSDSRKAELTELDVKLSEDGWEKRYQLAKAYYGANGNLNVPAGYKVEGVWLNKWLNEQKQIYSGKRDGKCLTKEQITRLEEIGIVWGENKELVWQKNFEALAAFVKENNTTKIPDNLTANGINLSSWLKRQQGYYRRGTLDSKKAEQLLSVGITLDVRKPQKVKSSVSKQNKEWLKNYSELVFYYNEHGDCNVPVRYTDRNGKDLSEWVRFQRESYFAGKLKADRIKKLEEIRFDWLKASERSWETRFSSAKAYFQKFGNLNVPVTYKDETGYILGRWVKRMRESRYELKTHGANGNQVKRLESIGMVWSN